MKTLEYDFYITNIIFSRSSSHKPSRIISCGSEKGVKEEQEEGKRPSSFSSSAKTKLSLRQASES